MGIEQVRSQSRQAVSRFYQAALDAVFPEFCVVCGLEGELLCTSCRGDAVITSQARGCPFCERETGTGATCRRCARIRALDGAISLSHYAEPAVKGLIKRWKYQFDMQVPDQLARWIGTSNLLDWLPNLPWELVPAALHPSRARERGFDQSAIIAGLLAHELDLPVNPCLARIKKTAPQARGGAKRRRAGDLSGAFAVVSPPPDCALLVDDVLTSGATLDAAAKALKQAGTDPVWGLVLARGN